MYYKNNILICFTSLTNIHPQTLNKFFYIDDTKRKTEVSTKHFMNGLLIALKK